MFASATQLVRLNHFRSISTQLQKQNSSKSSVLGILITDWSNIKKKVLSLVLLSVDQKIVIEILQTQNNSLIQSYRLSSPSRTCKMSSSNGGSDAGYSSGEENEAKAKSEEEDRPSKRQKVLPLQAIILRENMLNHESIAKAKKVYAASHQRNGSPDNIADMYCEFMTIKIMKGDYDPENAQFSPGGICDEFWHAHCLDTAGYFKFFKDVNAPSGEVVHHDALKSQDADDLIEKREENTRKVRVDSIILYVHSH